MLWLCTNRTKAFSTFNALIHHVEIWDLQRYIKEIRLCKSHLMLNTTASLSNNRRECEICVEYMFQESKEMFLMFVCLHRRWLKGKSHEICLCMSTCIRACAYAPPHVSAARVCVCVRFKVKHANVGLRLRKGVSPVRLPPNSIQRCKYWLCARCTHWRTLAIHFFKGGRIDGRFALILCLFADSVFIQQMHADEIATLGLLTIIHVNQLLHGNVSKRAAQNIFTPPPNIYIFYRFML